MGFLIENIPVLKGIKAKPIKILSGDDVWCMTPSLWHFIQTNWNMLKISLSKAFCRIMHGITEMTVDSSTVKVLKIQLLWPYNQKWV